MATNEKKSQPPQVPDRSAAPKGWPNMPARSAEHEPKPQERSAQVTEAQRELEREVPPTQK